MTYVIHDRIVYDVCKSRSVQEIARIRFDRIFDLFCLIAPMSQLAQLGLLADACIPAGTSEKVEWRRDAMLAIARDLQVEKFRTRSGRVVKKFFQSHQRSYDLRGSQPHGNLRPWGEADDKMIEAIVDDPNKYGPGRLFRFFSSLFTKTPEGDWLGDDPIAASPYYYILGRGFAVPRKHVPADILGGVALMIQTLGRTDASRFRLDDYRELEATVDQFIQSWMELDGNARSAPDASRGARRWSAASGRS